MCLELSYASRTSVINRNCAELSNIFLLPGDKRLAGCLLVWKPQGECREKYLLKSSFSLSRGKKRHLKKRRLWQVSSAPQRLSRQNSLSLLCFHGNAAIAGFSK